ncbi:MAG TPA: hypothetical protein VFG68_04940 [Fimbriiglobus sp.]|nr:hypothetical protein [Fimbriiglobus sp.]
MPAPTPPPEPVQTFPGGEDAPAYRWAFVLWVVTFLGVICLGLLSYLGLYVKSQW